MGTVTRCPCGHRNRCCETVRTRRRMRCRRTFGGWHRRIDWGWVDYKLFTISYDSWQCIFWENTEKRQRKSRIEPLRYTGVFPTVLAHSRILNSRILNHQHPPTNNAPLPPHPLRPPPLPLHPPYRHNRRHPQPPPLLDLFPPVPQTNHPRRHFHTLCRQTPVWRKHVRWTTRIETM